MKTIKFIDLFSGIGGFHLALQDWSSELVLACDIDPYCKKVYTDNFNPISILSDIREIDENKIPDFDLLCAGFPCQPFSKGGFQKGFNDNRGTLFFEVVRILRTKKPKFIILENVSSLVTHDNGNTFKVITSELEKLGYLIPENPLIIDSLDLGIPMYRKRIYIPGIRKDFINSDKNLGKYILDIANKSKLNLSIWDFIYKTKVDDKYYLEEYQLNLLNMWDEFYKNIDIKIIGFPIWTDIFSKYNFYKMTLATFPDWKQKIIIKNLNLYERNKLFIINWLKKYDNLKWIKNSSHKKFEWQAGENINSIWEGIIQFRPSGVRVKKSDVLSTLVAMNHPQIIGKYKRYITPDEIKSFQGFPKDFKLIDNDNISRKQLGNTITITVAKIILKGLLKFYDENRTSD